MEIKTLAGGAAMVLSLWLAADAARANDIVDAYTFAGTLATSVNGETSVTGQFTLDQTTGSLVTYSFDTPAGTLDGSDTFGGIATYSPAQSPAADFTEIYLNSYDMNVNLSLLFQTDISTFSGSTFYTGNVDVSGGSTISDLGCQGFPDCSNPGSSVFTSGEATFAVPEPSSWALMIGGLFGLGGLMRGRRSPQTEHAT